MAATHFPTLASGQCFRYPVTHTRVFHTRVFAFLDGTEQRYAEQAELTRFVLTWRRISKADLTTLQNFFIDCKGAYERQWDITIQNLGYPLCVVSGATNASPIVITSTGHPYVNDDWVWNWGAKGNTAANGAFQVTKLTANTFSLNGSTGNGAYTSGGFSRAAEHFDYCAFDSDTFSYTEEGPQLYTVQLPVKQCRP